MAGIRQFSRRFALTIAIGMLSARAAIMAAEPGKIPTEPLADAAANEPSLKYLPKDYWLVGNLDVKTCMEFLNSDQAKANPQYAAFRQAMQALSAMSGIDIEKEVDSITGFAAGDPDKEVRGLVAVRGSFDAAAAEARLAATIAQGWTRSEYKGKPLYAGPTGGFSFPDNATLLFGDVRQLQAAIDSLAKPQELPASLKNVLERTNGKSLVWAAVKPEPVLGTEPLAQWRTDNPELHTQLTNIKCLSVAFSMADDGLLIHALGFARSTNTGKNVFEYLSRRKDALLHTEGTNVVFCSLLVISDLASDGPYVQGSLRLTGKAIEELWNTKVIVPKH